MEGKASKQTFVINQSFVPLPKVCDIFTATSPTIIVVQNYPTIKIQLNIFANVGSKIRKKSSD
jgi:hypothetical protein